MQIRFAALAAVVFLAAGSIPGAATAQSITETMVKMYSEPNEYYLFEDDEKKVIHYKKDRRVQLCAGQSKHLVPLKVTHDGDSSQVAAGDCLIVEAKQISISPAEPLDPNWSMRVEVDPLD